MKIIINISKVIIIIFTLIFLSIIIVSLTINNSYDNIKICRSNNSFDINNYKNITNIKNIKLIEICDKTKIYIEVDEDINDTNVKGIILQIENIKKKYNDDEILEIILKNSYINYLIIIDNDEKIDIDFISS